VVDGVEGFPFNGDMAIAQRHSLSFLLVEKQLQLNTINLILIILAISRLKFAICQLICRLLHPTDLITRYSFSKTEAKRLSNAIIIRYLAWYLSG